MSWKLSTGILAVLTMLCLAGDAIPALAQGAAVERGFDLFVTDDTQTHFLGMPFEGVELPSNTTEVTTYCLLMSTSDIAYDILSLHDLGSAKTPSHLLSAG